MKNCDGENLECCFEMFARENCLGLHVFGDTAKMQPFVTVVFRGLWIGVFGDVYGSNPE